MRPETIDIRIPAERLEDMRRRLEATSWPGDFGNAGGHYGVQEDWLRTIVAYWTDRYDWRAHEVRMNRYPHYRVTIDGVPIHFIHIRSTRQNAIPLLLTHGWPWTFYDWLDLVDHLQDNPDGPAFDIVIPSLPGVAFSAPLATTGLNVRAIARLWVRLMTGLGHERFAAAGGDWGSLITAELGHAHADRLRAIHLTLVALPGVNHMLLGPADYAADEQWMPVRNAEALPLITSHVAVQSSDPQTLAYALADSPVGTAAWILERRIAWADRRARVEDDRERDFLCTTASLYWLTNTVGSSLRIYKEQFCGSGLGMEWPPIHDRRQLIAVPTAVAVAPKELALLPQAFVADRVNLKRWQLLPRGGHFLPHEEPAQLAAEYAAFFGAFA